MRTAAAFALLLLAPGYLGAQGQGCDLRGQPQELIKQVVGGIEMAVIRGPAEFDCTGGVVIRADSAVNYRASGELHLVGHAFYSDSLKSLTADWVNYEGRRGMVEARGSVVLTDRRSGSVVTGALLFYERASVAGEEPRATVEGRPHAVLHSASGRPRLDAAASAAGAGPPPEQVAEAAAAAAPDSAALPLEVDADRMEILGEREFRAWGRVELRRGEMRGFAHEAHFDQSRDRLELLGDARITGADYELSGGEIDAELEADRLRRVIGKGEVVLLSEELRVAAPELQIFLLEGEIERLVARREPQAEGHSTRSRAQDPRRDQSGREAAVVAAGRATGREQDPRPMVVASDFQLTADSVEAIAPRRRLERVVAVGGAHGERLDAPAESELADLPDVVARDWIQGDTIVAEFAEAATDSSRFGRGRAPSKAFSGSAADSLKRAERPERELERLVAIGGKGRARSVYRLRESGPQGSPSSGLNYMIASRITLVFRKGEVHEVQAEGPVHGMHVQPTRPVVAGPPRR
ncbi:MAG: hypothetical protein HY703_08630 [Gemmatimonadetes bacterium]|nr:hypothetical protein [Gemmatimonadota bacterium]